MNIFVFLLSVLLALTVFFSTGCGIKEEKTDTETEIAVKNTDEAGGIALSDNSPFSAVEGRELMILTDSEEEAKEIAGLYGIEFVDHSQGVAVFHTEEDPSSVVERGKKEGLPQLSINHRMELDEPKNP